MRLQGSRAPLCSTISESVLPLPASLSDPAPLHLRLQLARLAAPSFHRMGSTWSVARHARHSRETCCPPRSQWPECPHPVHGTRPLATGALITRAGRESVRPAPARYRNSAAMVLVARSYAYARALYHLIDIEPAVDRRQHAAEPRQIAEIQGSNFRQVESLLQRIEQNVSGPPLFGIGSDGQQNGLRRKGRRGFNRKCHAGHFGRLVSSRAAGYGSEAGHLFSPSVTNEAAEFG